MNTGNRFLYKSEKTKYHLKETFQVTFAYQNHTKMA